jgi:peptidoglycan/LPS O-acetylase OafA/YrhL
MFLIGRLPRYGGGILQRLSTRATISSENGKNCANVHLNYIPELNGLRAIAIGAVLLDHTLNSYFPGGFIGVDIFFVLSGWLITTILVREFERDNGINLGHFYARRALRLVPALLAMLTAYILFLFAKSVWKPDGDFFHDHLWAVLSTAFYVMNWTQAFDLGPAGYLLHTWSLGIEEQFYVFWPMTLIVILRYFGRASAFRFVLTLILIVIAWRTLLVFGEASPKRIYPAFDTRIDTLLMGCLLALVPLAQIHSLTARFSLCPVLILTVMLLTLRWTSPLLFLFGFPIVAFCAAWLISAALFGKPQSLLRQFLRWSPLTYCGQISYGFYLWHFPILIVVANHVSHQNFGELKAFTITAISTLLVASASYHILELPALRLRRKFQ